MHDQLQGNVGSGRKFASGQLEPILKPLDLGIANRS